MVVYGSAAENQEPLVVDRYFLFREIAAGGMASIHLARLLGPVGFARTVAIKRLHPQFAKERDFVTMFVDEARIVTSIRHPNVVPVLDVVALPGHLFLVMEYVHGEALHRLVMASIEARKPVPPGIVSAIGIHMLEGLHAAHEAMGSDGKPLDIIHRDVSPQNVLVGKDGLARVLDFGIAKAKSQMHQTTTGGTKGKLKYMAPEQLEGEDIDRKVDLWSAGVVLWEMLTLSRLFRGDNDGLVTRRILDMAIPPPSALATVSPQLDAVVMKALTRPRADRYQDARTMARALEAACPPASPREVAEWLEDLAGPSLREREALLKELELAADAGLPSVRTQLEVIADNAARGFDVVTGPMRPVSSADDATGAVGGRPPDRSSAPPPSSAFVESTRAMNDPILSPSRSIDVPAVVGPTILSRPPPAPKRSPAVAIIVAGLLFGGAIAFVGVAYKTLKARMAPAEVATSTAPPAVSSAPPMSDLPPVIEPAPPPTTKASAPAPVTTATSAATSTGVRPSASGRKPVRSPSPSEPDGLRLDHRK